MAAVLLTRATALAVVTAALAAAACDGGQRSEQSAKTEAAIPEASNLDRGSYSPEGSSIA